MRARLESCQGNTPTRLHTPWLARAHTLPPRAHAVGTRGAGHAGSPQGGLPHVYERAVETYVTSLSAAEREELEWFRRQRMH